MESTYDNLKDWQNANFVKLQGRAFMTLMYIFSFLKYEGTEDQLTVKTFMNITTSFNEWCMKTGNIVKFSEIDTYSDFSTKELLKGDVLTSFKINGAVLAASSDDMKKYYKEKLYELAKIDGYIPDTKKKLLDTLETMWE